jgi:Prolyl oligopeptidase family
MENFTVPKWNSSEVKLISEIKEKNYKIYQYELPDASPVHGHVDPITVDLYSVKRGNPTVLLHPVLGGKNVLTKIFAKFFTFFKWNAVIIHRARYPMEETTTEGFDEGIRNIVMNNLQAFEWMESEGIIDRDKTISIGASLGGITNAMLSSVLPIKGFICLVAGGSVPEVVTESKLNQIKNWKESVLKRRNWNQETFKKEYLKTMKTDPILSVQQSDPSKVMLWIALFDHDVPTKYQFKLRRAFNKHPLTFYTPTGHVTIVLLLPIILPIMLIWSWWKIR